jgi:lipopolysaccharide export system protein LptA
LKKILLGLVALISLLNSASKDVEITASKFESYEAKLYSKFIGNVVVTKENDVIYADTLYVYFDKKKNPTKYEAISNVKFTVHSKANQYKGKSKKLVYFPNSKDFHLIDDAYVEDVKSDKKSLRRQNTL